MAVAAAAFWGAWFQPTCRADRRAAGTGALPGEASGCECSLFPDGLSERCGFLVSYSTLALAAALARAYTALLAHAEQFIHVLLHSNTTAPN